MTVSTFTYGGGVVATFWQQDAWGNVTITRQYEDAPDVDVFMQGDEAAEFVSEIESAYGVMMPDGVFVVDIIMDAYFD